MTAEATTETKSIIGSKYAGKYKEPDWLGLFIAEHAMDPVMKTVKIKDEDGKPTDKTEEVETNKTKLNLDNFFDLCRANNIDVTKMEEQRDRPNAPGRIRMTLGNSLRAAAKKRHGLFDIEENWHDAPVEFLDGAERKEDQHGHKIVKETT